MKDFPDLPVAAFLPEIRSALLRDKCAVIDAEPGAGKTMLVPVLAKETAAPAGKVILVEPRRIAARSAAYGIARMHGFQPGRECGFAVRGEQCSCDDDGILAVTPGIFLNMLQNDPALEGICAVIFDEFHERQLEADLALTLTLDIRDSLRDDLLLIVMSATMDSAGAGKFLRAPVIKVPGRGFPVEICWKETPNDIRDIPKNTARAVLETLKKTSGDMLVFLPGAYEISLCREILSNALDDSFALHPLHGSLPLAEQRAALAPAPSGIRKIILATNVAESSLTIDNISCVVDSGWEKRAVWQPGSQMTFLETRRITADSAGQRAGRAGRTAPGKAVRCYSKLDFGNFSPHPTPEILSADLSALLLTVKCWGSEISRLRWLDEPPPAAVARGEKLLSALGLLSDDLRPSEKGKRAAQLPISPRMGAMMLTAAPEARRTAAEFAAVLEEKDDFLRFSSCDLTERVARMRKDPANWRLQKIVMEKLLKEFPAAPGDDRNDPGILIAAAFPEWIGRQRQSNGTVYQLAGGGAAALKEDDFLRKEEFLAIARLDGGNSGNSVIRLAVPVKRESLEKVFSGSIKELCTVSFDEKSGKPVAAMERRLGELTLSRRPCPVPDGEIPKAVVTEALHRNIPLPPPADKRGCSLIARIRFAKKAGMDDLPEIGDEFFASLAPMLQGEVSNLADLKKICWYDLIKNQLDYPLFAELDRLCPEFFTAPTGMKFPIDYSGEQPSLAIQVQQLYGVNKHPAAGKNAIPLRIELLSPARRPVQITCDLPGFWHGSWELVRKEMRARYPKHEWPEDPGNAAPMRHSVTRRPQ